MSTIDTVAPILIRCLLYADYILPKSQDERPNWIKIESGYRTEIVVERTETLFCRIVDVGRGDIFELASYKNCQFTINPIIPELSYIQKLEDFLLFLRQPCCSEFPRNRLSCKNGTITHFHQIIKECPFCKTSLEQPLTDRFSRIAEF